VRLGLVGYGAGGRYFHAPFAVAARDVELPAWSPAPRTGAPSWPRTSPACPPTARWPSCWPPGRRGHSRVTSSKANHRDDRAYQDYCARFAAALRGDGEFPVPAEQAVHTLEVLDGARASAEQNRVLEVDPA
jgi:predicted dehydrogenase